MMLVNKKMTARATRMIATRPVIWPVKYKASIIRAKTVLMKRSAFPIFLIMFPSFALTASSLEGNSTDNKFIP